MPTAQDILNTDFLEDDTQDSNDTLELFKFMQHNATPLTKNQLHGILLLQENGLSDIANMSIQYKKAVTPTSIYYETLNKLTLADRIKGNAKLSHLMKATSQNPAQSIRAEDLQAQGMSTREIDRYS